MMIGGIASSRSTSTAASTARRPPSPLASDAASEVGVPTSTPLLPLLPELLELPLFPLEFVPEPDEVPVDDELEPADDDGVGEPLFAGAGALPCTGLPVEPMAAAVVEHGPWPN